ncbi:hypothetical protein F0726_01914 [Acidithiobacillus caldus]|nr:hypothetical protein F0726_01914 [Acidithiobacillus caldus]
MVAEEIQRRKWENRSADGERLIDAVHPMPESRGPRGKPGQDVPSW